MPLEFARSGFTKVRLKLKVFGIECVERRFRNILAGKGAITLFSIGIDESDSSFPSDLISNYAHEHSWR